MNKGKEGKEEGVISAGPPKACLQCQSSVLVKLNLNVKRRADAPQSKNSYRIPSVMPKIAKSIANEILSEELAKIESLKQSYGIICSH